MKTSLKKLLVAASLSACGGPQANVGQFPGESVYSSQQQQVACTSPAPAAFANALCVCDDLQLAAGLEVSDSLGGVASVGVNGSSAVVGTHDVQGNYIAFKGITGVGRLVVGQSFGTTGDLMGVGYLKAGKNVDVGGRLSTIGLIDVGGALRVNGGTTLLGKPTVGSLGAYQAPALPCGCGAAQLVDIKGEVAKAKNAASLGRIVTVGDATATLTSGRYFISSALNVGRTRFKVDGAVAVYVEGSLDSVGDEMFELTGDSTLDLYVAGGIRQVGRLQFAGAKSPSQIRVYVAGQVASVGAQEIFGSLYAPQAKVQLVGATVVHGSLFAGSLQTVGVLKVMQAKVPAPGSAGSNCTHPDDKLPPGSGTETNPPPHGGGDGIN